MSTGNLRSASRAAYIAITQKDRESAFRSLRYFTIIFSFVFGAFLGGLLTFNYEIKTIWGAAIILMFTVLLFRIGERRRLGKL